MFEKQSGGTPHIPLKGIWSDVQTGGDTAHKKVREYKCCGWVAFYIETIMPLRGSILQVGTCKILSLAENPRWSRVWQKRVGTPHKIRICSRNRVGGTPHIPLKGIWSDVQTGGDTAHKKVKEYKCCGVAFILGQ